MSNTATKRMISAYSQTAEPTRYLSSFFQSPPENFYNGESVEIDIEREDEDVAIAIHDMSAGYRMNSADVYTNKEFKPPIFKEAAALNAMDLIKRVPGQDPFQNPDFQANATVMAFKLIRKIEKKIRRAIEVQASQVLTTGTVDLTDSTGASVYTVDYKPKVTHFPTAGTAWNAGGADPIGDLLSLSNVIRNNGLADVGRIIMGEGSFEIALTVDSFKERFNNQVSIDMGAITRMSQPGNGGGNFRGWLEVGNYRLEIWTYGARYKHWQTGVKTLFVPNDKVIVMAPGRLDATFGAIPRIVPPEARALPFLPPRMSGGGVDLFTNAWVSDDGEQLFVGVGVRPMLIPTAIDTYGCLDTGI